MRDTKWAVHEAKKKLNQLNIPRAQVIKSRLERESSGEVKPA